MKNKLTRSLVFKHLNKYGQYSQSPDWNKWYASVAPLKGKRVVQTLLTYKSKNARVLDLGCGIGLTFAILAQNFINSIGCDVGEKEISATKILLKNLNLKNRLAIYDGKHLPFTDKSFDIVTSIEVIEHVDNPAKMLQEIRRVLKPDGILHITTANKLWPIEPHYKLPFLSYLPKSFANLYLKILRRGTSYDDIHLPTYGEFYKLVSKYFEVEDITLDVIANYKRYGLGKERGIKVVILGNILKNKLVLKIFKPFLLWCSLGWLFIARPKVTKSRL